MKKILAIATFCAALLLTGCSKGENIAVEGNSLTFKDAEITINYPEDWDISNGEVVYENMYDTVSDAYTDIDDMKAAFEEDGVTYYSMGYSDDRQSMVVINSLDMTSDDGEDEVPLEEYARTVHDSTIFDYYASGYKTGDDSSFSQQTYGGKTGYLSHFEIYSSDEEEKAFYIGFSDFMFQVDTELYSIQVCYFSEEEKEAALSIFDNITAV